MQLERLDLHGLTLSDAMSRFLKKYNWLAGQAGGDETRAIDVIHGRGLGKSEGGVIRDAVRDLLKREGKRISGYDAQLLMRGAEYLLDNCGKLAYMQGEDVDRNGGHTIVVPRSRLRIPPEYLR